MPFAKKNIYFELEISSSKIFINKELSTCEDVKKVAINIDLLKHKKSRKHWVYGTLNYLRVFLGLLLANALSDHSFNNLLETCNVSTCNIVAFHAVFLSSFIDVVVDTNHDVLKL